MEPTRQQIAEALEAFPEVRFAVLFGSRATGKARRKSDVDLAVRFDPEPVGWALGGVVDSLQHSLARRVDLVDLETTRSSLLRLEISKGALLKGDRAEWIDFRLRAVREWRDFEPRYRRFMDERLRKWVQTDRVRASPEGGEGAGASGEDPPNDAGRFGSFRGG